MAQFNDLELFPYLWLIPITISFLLTLFNQQLLQKNKSGKVDILFGKERGEKY